MIPSIMSIFRSIRTKISSADDLVGVDSFLCSAEDRIHDLCSLLNLLNLHEADILRSDLIRNSLYASNKTIANFIVKYDKFNITR